MVVSHSMLWMLKKKGIFLFHWKDKMSTPIPQPIIPLPVTANYVFQTLGTLFSSDKPQVKNLHPESPCILSSRNTTFQELEENSFKYQFIYKYNLADFVEGKTNPLVAGRGIFISHDQIRLNYTIPLVPEISVNGILENPEFTSRTPQQDCFPLTGITAGQYVKSIQAALPTILSECPVDVTKIADFHPVYFLGEYRFITICGEVTTKISTTGIMRYRECSPGRPVKVLLWGTGYQELAK